MAQRPAARRIQRSTGSVICDPSAQKCKRNDSTKTSFELEFIACTPGLIAKHSRTGARSCSYSFKDFITFAVIGRSDPEIPSPDLAIVSSKPSHPVTGLKRHPRGGWSGTQGRFQV